MRSSRILLAAVVAVSVGCGVDSSMEVKQNDGAITWEQFLSVVYQEPADEDGQGVFVANGDEVFDDMSELRAFYDTAIAKPSSIGVMRGELIVDLTSTGKDNRWSATAAQNLTYCVSTKFGSRYTAVVNAMASATAEWEKYANVNFIHVSAQDSNCTARNSNVVFDVRPTSSGGQYLARSFFPDTSRRSRNILIDGSSFTTSAPLTLTGILRHELGHTIGFRHEHTRPEAGACFEDNGWRALTTYDSSSVMHYPQCNGTGDWSLVLTTKDQTGAGILYP